MTLNDLGASLSDRGGVYLRGKATEMCRERVVRCREFVFGEIFSVTSGSSSKFLVPPTRGLALGGTGGVNRETETMAGSRSNIYLTNRAREAERIARRVAREHPDPEARRVYRWIAERAASRSAQGCHSGLRRVVAGPSLASASRVHPPTLQAWDRDDGP